MSRSKFDEKKHPRGDAGQFREKATPLTVGIRRDGFPSPYKQVPDELTPEQVARMKAALHPNRHDRAAAHADPAAAGSLAAASRYWGEVRDGVRDPNAVDDPWVSAAPQRDVEVYDPTEWEGLMDGPEMMGVPRSDRGLR